MVSLHHAHPSLYVFTNSEAVTKCVILFYCYHLPRWVVQTAVLHNAFYKVTQRALGMSLWKHGGSGHETFGNHSSKHHPYRRCDVYQTSCRVSNILDRQPEATVVLRF
jgi:hypothetical protein